MKCQILFSGTLSPKETICMKCQILFSGKNKKNNIILSSAENAQRVVKVNGNITVLVCFIIVLYFTCNGNAVIGTLLL